jgi:ribonuclease D
MRIVTDQAALEALCAELRAAPYLAVDTEFMRERTFWPQLCLVQIARPGDDPEAAAVIDPIAGALDLAPLHALMAEPSITKVFHAARQDIEIFHHEGGVIPAPLFDTQVAAMVCGYGEQVGYETLVRKLAKASLDKSSRFTDWARRPLSERQLTYALGDVTHLRVIYEKLARRLKETGRGPWVAEEMGVLTDPATYRAEPEEAWRRLKMRSNNPRFLAAAKALAAWRERESQARDVPRSRVLKDDALLEVASSRPATPEELSASRMLQREGRKPETQQAILAALREAEAMPEAERPRPEEKPQPRPGSAGLVELLKVLLKARSDETGVASKLIASSADLDALAGEEQPAIPALSGWRRAVFGEDALRLKRGEIALTAGPKGVRAVAAQE